MSGSVCFLLSRALFFPLLPGFFLRLYRITPLPFHNHPWEACPARKYSSHRPAKLPCRKAQRVAGEKLCPGQVSHPQAGDNGGRKGDLAGVSGKDDWPWNDQFPYRNALVISIPSLKQSASLKVSGGLINPDPGRPKYWR